MQTDRYVIIRRSFAAGRLGWPKGARVALMVAPNIEFFHIDKVIPGAPNTQLPDVTGYALRDYWLAHRRVSHDGSARQARHSCHGAAQCRRVRASSGDHRRRQ